MQELPSEFEGRADQRKYRFRLLKRTGKVAMLEKRLKRPPKGGENWRGLEVVRVQQWPARTFMQAGRAVTTEAKEGLPSPEQWGTDGFSCTTREDAEVKFAQLAW